MVRHLTNNQGNSHIGKGWQTEGAILQNQNCLWLAAAQTHRSPAFAKKNLSMGKMQQHKNCPWLWNCERWSLEKTECQARKSFVNSLQNWISIKQRTLNSFFSLSSFGPNFTKIWFGETEMAVVQWVYEKGRNKWEHYFATWGFNSNLYFKFIAPISPWDSLNIS